MKRGTASLKPAQNLQLHYFLMFVMASERFRHSTGWVKGRILAWCTPGSHLVRPGAGGGNGAKKKWCLYSLGPTEQTPTTSRTHHSPAPGRPPLWWPCHGGLGKKLKRRSEQRLLGEDTPCWYTSAVLSDGVSCACSEALPQDIRLLRLRQEELACSLKAIPMAAS